MSDKDVCYVVNINYTESEVPERFYNANIQYFCQKNCI